MENKYNVICIDDELEKLEDFADYCEISHHIKLALFKTQKAGLDEYAKNQSYYDALILDVQVLDESEDELPDEMSMMKARDRILKDFPNLPFFISTGQQEIQSDERFGKIVQQLYWKGKDDEKLCKDIIKAIEETPERKLINKYPAVFTKLPSDIHKEILDIIRIIDENNCCKRADVFNSIRKLLDWIFRHLYAKGLTLVELDGSNLSECSRSIKDGVPIYIKRHLHSLVEICNEGSHRLIIDEDVRTGKAPYLVISTLFELINVIVWINQLPDQIVQEDNQMTHTSKYDSANEYEGKEMILEQDDKGNYHCGPCLLPYSIGQSVCVGEKIIVVNVVMNDKQQTKDIYPYFAKFKRVNNPKES